MEHILIIGRVQLVHGRIILIGDQPTSRGRKRGISIGQPSIFGIELCGNEGRSGAGDGGVTKIGREFGREKVGITDTDGWGGLFFAVVIGSEAVEDHGAACGEHGGGREGEAGERRVAECGGIEVT